MKKLIGLISLTAVMLAICACGEAEEIKQVKKLSLPYCESYTVAEVMDSIMIQPYWGQDSDVSGKTTVVVEGMVIDGNKQVPVEFKFNNAIGDHAELLTFSIDQRAQPVLIAHKYFARVCSDDYLNHFQSSVKSTVETAKNIANGIKETYLENETEINEFSDKVINASGKLLNKALDKLNEALDKSEESEKGK